MPIFINSRKRYDYKRVNGNYKITKQGGVDEAKEFLIKRQHN